MKRFNFILMLFFIMADAKADNDDLLSQLTAQLTQASIVHGQFHQEKQLKFLTKPLLSTGEFTYDQEKGVIWKTLTPIMSLLVMNASHILISSGEQAIPASFGRIFPAIIGNHLNTLSADFTITGNHTAETWNIQMIPKDPLLAKVITNLSLSGDTVLRSLEIHETSGNFSHIEFTQMSYPISLTTEQSSDFARLSP